ncbi:MAG: ABC transporter permease [Bryobacter sp.]|nr:ABC transporter permease [Bryobacter sp.]
MAIWQRFRNTLFPQTTSRAAAEEEARFHIAMRTEELLAQGLSPEDAAAQARRAFGNVLAYQEAAGDRDVFVWLEHWLLDLRVAWRRLRRSPLFLVTSVFLLAVGLGANAAVFSIVDQLFLQPLPLPNPERLFVIQETFKGERANSNPERIADWARRVPAIESAMGYYGEMVPLETKDGKRGISTYRVAGDYLGVLGLQLLEGRKFSPDELRGEPLAMLTPKGKALGRVGDSLSLGGVSYRIVGVLAPNRMLGPEVELVTPAARDVLAAPRIAGFLPVVVRLRSSLDPNVLAAQVDAAARQMAEAFPATDKERGAYVLPAQSAWTEEAADSARMLQAATLLLLVITLLNLASLLAARTAARERESAIRSFLGASRGSILRLHFAEAGILVSLGCIAAFLVATWTLALLQEIFGSDFPPVREVSLDLRAMAALLLVGLAACLLLTFVMSWQSASSQRTQRRSRPLLRGALVVGEAALGVLLISAAFSLASAFAERQSRPLGFVPQNILIARIDLPWSASQATLVSAMDRALEEIAALPGVSRVGVTDRVPLTGGTQSGEVLIQGAAKAPGGLAPRGLAPRGEVGFRMASASFFSTLQIPLLQGDTLGQPGAVVVNETFARRYLGSQAIGRYVARKGEAPRWWRVVGVVGSVRADVGEAEARPEIYLPYREFTWPKLEFVIATSQPAANLAPVLRRLSGRLSPDALLNEVLPYESDLASLNRQPRQQRDLVLSFGFVALVLVVAGVYALIRAELERRTREIGVRLAIGAQPFAVAALLLRQAGGLALAVLLLSLPLALFALPELLSPRASVAAGLLVAFSMAMAALPAAWRASRIAPTQALRVE